MFAYKVAHDRYCFKHRPLIAITMGTIILAEQMVSVFDPEIATSGTSELNPIVEGFTPCGRQALIQYDINRTLNMNTCKGLQVIKN